MIKTILIIMWVSGSYAGGVTTQEFDSQTSCEAAAQALQAHHEGRVSTYCVEK